MLEIEESPVTTRESLIRECYEEVFPVAAAYAHRQGGNIEEAKEVFQVALMIYYEKLVDSEFEPKRNHHSYLFGIFKNQWSKHQFTARLTTSLGEYDQRDHRDPEIQKHRLLLFLRQSGQRCMDLLQSFYYEKTSMKKLADRFGYRSERSATVQKYKCLEKVRNEVKQKSLQYEDFFE